MKTSAVLNNNRILHIWELSLRQHPVDRAITILCESFPDQSWNDLVQLSIGTRNHLLLKVWEQTFGQELHGTAHCRECKKPLEFIAEVDEFLAPERSHAEEADYYLEWEKYQIILRPLNSLDLAAIANSSDIDAARHLLIQKAVSRILFNQQELSVDKLTEQIIALIAQHMAKCDPQANLTLDLECPECGYPLSLPFDIVDFLWREISAQAKRVLREVKTLARYYGWSEQDILSMSAVRRYHYIEMMETH